MTPTPAELAEIRNQTLERLNGDDRQWCENVMMMWVQDSSPYRAAAALLSILDAREPDWQPIETAPKDGTPVDLWMKSGGRLTNVLWVSVVPAEILHNDCWLPGWKYSALEFQILPEEQFSHWRHISPPISAPASEPANQEKASK